MRRRVTRFLSARRSSWWPGETARPTPPQAKRSAMTELPMTVAAEGLPERVTVYEVGPRDGLQNEAGLIATEVKAELIRRLLAAGLPIVEATSFVHPQWVPQLADAAELM